jgi:hypothetical protein
MSCVGIKIEGTVIAVAYGPVLIMPAMTIVIVFNVRAFQKYQLFAFKQKF